MQTKALAVLAGVAGALGLGYFLTRKPARTASPLKGQIAQAGDQVWIETSALPPGTLAYLPQGVGSLIVQVAQIGGGMLTGPIVGYAIQDDNVLPVDPSVAPAFTAPISSVSAVYHAGIQIA